MNKEFYEEFDNMITNSDESDYIQVNNSDEIRPGDVEYSANSDEDNDMSDSSNTTKAWYILPIILKNDSLKKKDNIESIEITELDSKLLIKVMYKTSFNANTLAKDESAYYNDYRTNEANVVNFEVPEDKVYICSAIAKSGYAALNKHLLQEYFLN